VARRNFTAEATFGGLVEQIGFRPESIFGFRKPEEIPMLWSEKCGCFERHLQRRYLNALFPPERRKVTTSDITEARSRDSADLQQLLTEIGKAFSEMKAEPAQVSVGEVLRQRNLLEGLIFRCAEVGDIANVARASLIKVHNTLVSTMRGVCSPEQEALLDAAVAGSETLQQTWGNTFLCAVKRSDTPILKEELLASLLSENVETVRLLADILFKPEQRGKLHELATELIAIAQNEGYAVPDAGQKLSVLAAATASPSHNLS